MGIRRWFCIFGFVFLDFRVYGNFVSGSFFFSREVNLFVFRVRIDVEMDFFVIVSKERVNSGKVGTKNTGLGERKRGKRKEGKREGLGF